MPVLSSSQSTRAKGISFAKGGNVQQCLREEDLEGDGIGEASLPRGRAGACVGKSRQAACAVARLRASEKRRQQGRAGPVTPKLAGTSRRGLLGTKGENKKRSRIMQGCTCTYSKKRRRRGALRVEKRTPAPAGPGRAGVGRPVARLRVSSRLTGMSAEKRGILFR